MASLKWKETSSQLSGTKDIVLAEDTITKSPKQKKNTDHSYTGLPASVSG